MNKFLRVLAIAAVAAVTLTTVARAQGAVEQAAPDQAAPADQAPPPALANITPDTATVNPFPPEDPKQFTATFPTKETVETFLTQLWGYDANRIFQVAAIRPTIAKSISQVVVFVTERGLPADQTKTTAFLVLDDGKHGIAGDTVIDFGAKPFAEKHALLLAKANGPSYGSANKNLELVEFADFQCPHCKDAQENMVRLATDFPTAHIVFQNFPLVQIHKSAFQSAAYSLCVAKLKPENSNEAFRVFVKNVYDNQDGLTPEKTKETLDAAVVKAGLDAAKVAACADTQVIKDELAADIQLAKDAEVDSTPTLVVNGRSVPLAGIAYDTLKDIVNYQAQLDGVKLPPPPAVPAAAPAAPAKQ